HNIGSFTLPDEGTVPASVLALGKQAAEDALKIRQELGQPAEIMRANWLVGNHYYRSGDLAKAKYYLNLARDHAVKLGDSAGIAWSDTYLAKVIRQSAKLSGQKEPQAAVNLEKEARRIALQKSGTDMTIDLLRHIQETKN